MDATAIRLAAMMAAIEPDRGNRYATRTVQTKGAARHEMWEQTCRLLATEFAPADRAEFLSACGRTSDARVRT